MLNRRNLLAGLGIGLAVPAIIRTPGLLMPVRPVLVEPVNGTIVRQGVNQFVYFNHMVYQQNAVGHWYVHQPDGALIAVADPRPELPARKPWRLRV